VAHSSWGSGWPSCQSDKAVPLAVRLNSGGTVDFPGGVRREALELFSLLLGEADRRGYKLVDGWCWGGACRPIKTPSGVLGTTPSNHSWFLAIDVNAPENAFGGSTHTIPDWMVELFRQYGFGWGGDWSGTKDWMHFEYLGSMADCERDTARARFDLGGDEMAFEEYARGFDAYREKFKEKNEDPGPPPDGKPADFKKGWQHARFAATNPRPLPV
jgi:hypothetical protein